MDDEQPITVCAAVDLGTGEARVVPGRDNRTGSNISVFHAEDGNFYAIDDTCTHEVASLADGWIEGTQVECPTHSAVFCLKTGQALCMPATRAVRTHRVELREGAVVLYPNTSAAASA